MTVLTVRDRGVYGVQTEQPVINGLPLDVQRMILDLLPSSDLKEVRQACPSFRDCVKDITCSRFSKQCDMVLIQLEPYLSERDQEHLEELLTQFRQGAQVVAGVPLAFDTKNARTVFRQELIRCLVDSMAPVGLEPNSLSRLNFIELLPEEFEHVVALTSFIQEVKVIQNDPNVQDWQKWTRYERLISQVFFTNPMSSIGMRDAICLLDPEISKRLISRLFYQDVSLALEFAQHFSLPHEDDIFFEAIPSLLERGQFDIAQSMLQYISHSDLKNQAFHAVIGRLAIDGQIDNAIKLVLVWPEGCIKNSCFQTIGRAVNFKKSNSLTLNIKEIVEVLTFYAGRLKPLDLVSLYAGFSEKLSLRLKTSVGEAALKNQDFGLVMLVATDRRLDKDITDSLRERVVKEIFNSLPQEAEEAYRVVEKFLESTENPILIRDDFLSISFEQGFYELALKLLNQRRNKGYDLISRIGESLPSHVKKVADEYVSVGDFKMALKFADYNDEVREFLLDEMVSRAFTQVELLQEGSFKDKWYRSLELCFPGLLTEEMKSHFKFQNRLDNKLMKMMRFEDQSEFIDGVGKLIFKKLGQVIPLHLRTETLRAFVDNCSGARPPQMDKQDLPDEYQEIEFQLKQVVVDWISIVDSIEQAADLDPEIEKYVRDLYDEYTRSGTVGVQAVLAGQNLTEARQTVVTALLKVLQWDSEGPQASVSASELTDSVKRRKVGDRELRGLGIDPAALDTEEMRRKLVAPRTSRGTKE